MLEHRGRGIILRVTTTQDSDAIVRILTSRGELLTAYARAGMKSRRRFAGALQPLLSVEYRARTKGGSDMAYLEELTVRRDFQKIRENFSSLSTASYLSELSEINAQEGLENTALYNLLGNAFMALEQSGVDCVRLICQFEVKLLALMGWMPDTDDLPISMEDRQLVNELLNSTVQNGDLKTAPGNLKSLAKILQNMLRSHLGAVNLKSSRFLEFVTGPQV